MSTSINRGALILSASQALLGEISASVRAVRIKLENNMIVVLFVVDGPLSSADRESFGAISAQIIADFPNLKIAEEIQEIKFPQKIQYDESWYSVYRRRE